MQVRILDSRPGSASVLIDFPCEAERITLRELIRRRVSFEVERHNRDRPEVFVGLIQPEMSEQILNGTSSKLRCYREVDPERQVARAVRAFAEQRFVVIAGGRQIESLDEELDLGRGEVEFLKLAPLMGG